MPREPGRPDGPAGPGEQFGIIGRSPAIRELLRRIERVAPVDVPVLIRGESGTGKELIAGAVQRLSARKARPFATINCADLTRDLLRSELFGHERGAFTGAVSPSVGLVARLHSGTLFMDEIGELTPDAQAMLLRFLQHGKVRPVGSTETKRVDVRLIAATHRNLETAVADGALRHDLYYRLHRVVLEVPPLRERQEDIPLLIRHLVHQINQRYGLAVEGVTPEAMVSLEGHPWPGNVRELEAVLEQAMIFSSVDWITPEDLRFPAEIGEGRPAVVAPSSPQPYERLRPALRREAALRIVSDRGAVTRRELQRVCGISHQLARLELAALARLGHLRRVGNGRSTRYVLP